jgi:hypothetical protein
MTSNPTDELFFSMVEDRPYTMRPTFKKLIGPLRCDPPNAAYLAQKSKELAAIAHPYGLWACSEQAVTDQIVQSTARHLGLQANHVLDLGYQLEEDVVILHHGQLQAFFVAFPSGWDPLSKFMMPLAAIHQPVADGDELRRASPKIAEVMASGNGPWSRTVWTLTANPELSNHPSYAKVEPLLVDGLFFRYEVQTFDTITPGVTSVFLIRTVVVPFLEIADTPQKVTRVKNSINSMSEAILDYKNLHGVKALLNA